MEESPEPRLNEAAERFEVRQEGELAFLSYALVDGRLFLMHTDVPAPLEGRGVGTLLVRTALEHARSEGLPVTAFCPFARAWIDRHPEYHDLLG